MPCTSSPCNRDYHCDLCVEPVDVDAFKKSHPDDLIVDLDIRKMTKMWPVPLGTIWERVLSPIRPSEIRAAASRLKLGEGAKAYRPMVDHLIWTRWDHIRRAAYLMVHGWPDAIDVDVGVPALGDDTHWPVCEGNHRLLAALARGDKSIRASVSGDEALIEKLRWRL